MTGFSPYAVETGGGPHVTPTAGVVHAGRYWTTTSRTSSKARSVRAHHRSGALLADDAGWTVVNGRTAAFSLRDPEEALHDPLGAPRWAGAVARLGLGQLRELLGYVEAAHRIPRAWLPDRRALLATRLDQQLSLVGDEVVERRGAWDRRPTPLRRSEPGAAPPSMLELASLDDDQRALISGGGPISLGVLTPEGPVVVPARWTRGRQIAASRAALELLQARLPGPACLVADESTGRRPDEKMGVLLRGTGCVVDVAGPAARLVLDTDRLTTWDGFEADTRRVAS